ncbi:MAG: hypothetical protein AAFP70_10765 [Calditrichota bacterium]
MRRARKTKETYQSSQIPAGEIPVGRILLFLVLLALFAWLMYRLLTGGSTTGFLPAANPDPEGPAIQITGMIVDDDDLGIQSAQIALAGDTTLSGVDGEFLLNIPQDAGIQDMVITHPESKISISRSVDPSSDGKRDFVIVFAGKTQVITRTVPAPQTTNPAPQTFTQPQPLQPSSRPQTTSLRGNQVMVDAAWDTFVQRDRDLSSTYTLVDIETRRNGSVSNFSGVWSNGSRDSRVFRSSSWDQFRSRRNQLRGQGYRIKDVEVGVGTNDFEYVGLWERGSADHKLWVGLTWQQFLQKRTEYLKEGLQLIDVEGYTRAGETRYAGIWAPGRADKIWKAKNNNGFISRHRQYRGEGHYLKDFETVVEDGATQYIGIWLPGNTANKIWINDAQSGFENKGREFSAEGLELIDLELRPNGSRQAFSGVWTGLISGNRGTSTTGNQSNGGDFKLLEE